MSALLPWEGETQPPPKDRAVSRASTAPAQVWGQDPHFKKKSDSKNGSPKESRRVFSCLGSELRALTESPPSYVISARGSEGSLGFLVVRQRFLGQNIDISDVSLKPGLNHELNVN